MKCVMGIQFNIQLWCERSNNKRSNNQENTMFEFNFTKFLAFALVISIFLRVVYLLIVKNWNYFSERNIVCYERGMPVIGTLLGNVQTILGKKSLPELSQIFTISIRIINLLACTILAVNHHCWYEIRILYIKFR